jgi:ribonuclease HI
VVYIRQEVEEVIVYCDGRCEGSGKESVGKYGYVIYKGKCKVAEGEGIAGRSPTLQVDRPGRGKEMTANVAEYIAVLRALEWLRDAGYDGSEIRVRGDSRLVMQQLGMLCVTKSWRLRPWHRKVRELSRHFQIQWEWIPRAWNIEADARANFKTS